MALARLQRFLLRYLWLPVVLGQFGGDDYKPPVLNCPVFQCPEGQKPAPSGAQVAAYGCNDNNGLSFLNAGSVDPANPLAGLQKQKTVDKCCVEKDICHQTCGMSSQVCQENFQKCSKKICKGDSSCVMMAQLSDLMSSMPGDGEGKDEPDFKAACKAYEKGQQESCQCVAEDQWEKEVERQLISFYEEFNPEKLDESGEIKDKESIWKNWRGKEHELFFELTKKYKDEAVEHLQRPSKSRTKVAGGGQAPQAVQETKEQKVKRLKKEKNAAVAAEDYQKAKKLSRKLKRLDPHDEF